MKLLILESPSKRKTIQGFLGRDWRVEASFGHITELANDGEDNLGFAITSRGVEPRYVPRGKRGKQVLSKLRKLAKQSEQVCIATDPDREGESIGWHLAQQLHLPKSKLRRVRYSEISEKAVTQAIANAAQSLDQDLADAARARQVLDKLVGYKVSPLLWNSSGGKSAGRVQSAALAIVCRREKERQDFTPEPYWSVWVRYGEGFKAYFLGTEQAEEGDAAEADDDATTADELPAVEGRRIWKEADAKRLVEIAQKSAHQVMSVEQRTTHRKPPAPFTTSTLQQAAGSKLGFSTGQVMKVAQQLFEGLDLPQGRKSLITYHRTDAPVLSDEFKATAKAWLEVNDSENVPEQTASYRAKKGAQEAHEAIRPTYLDIHPDSVRQTLSEKQYQLYSLIWHRAIAACCRHARIAKTRIVSESGGVYWEAKGQIVEFEGYARYWNNLKGDEALPEIRKGQALELAQSKSERRKTSPPPRYSEAQLVQTLEKLGVGRPSTFAATVQTLKSRKYVHISKRKLAPSKLGMETYRVLAATVPDLLKSDFTAEMEAALDAIAQGEKDWQRYLCRWNSEYFQPALKRAKGYVQKNYDPSGSDLPEDKLTKHQCPVCGAALEQHFYQKDDTTKAMLRCSADKADCDKVAYFWTSREQWWSPEYGELSA
ncbi:MAG: type I DNA topoisomerase [Leptolyngbya sp. SIO4C5]|nr:type I DNA topoisomerase [Leptolyngbya sp. SIO4C5]